MANVLVIDDEAAICWAFRSLIEKAGHTAVTASNGRRGREHLDEAEFVFLDVRLPDCNGLDLLEDIKSQRPSLPVVVMTAHGGLDVAIQAMQKGAYDYLVKPVDIDMARRLMAQALESKALHQRSLAKQSSLLVGRHVKMQELFKNIGILASSDAPVLIQGESGTGKELVARALHQASPRHKKPFEPIDCASLPAELVESELFGHERGAFTGSVGRQGRLQKAQGGTLFFDEIGELPLSSQPKFLRFLAEREVVQLGSEKRISLDVRIVAATNRDLEKEVEAGRFRKDLFYRLNVLSLELPPLRERRQDIPHLVEHFLSQSHPQLNISKAVMALFQSYHWPGNIRELKNVVEHAALLARSNDIQINHCPANIQRVQSNQVAPGSAPVEALVKLIPDLLTHALSESQSPHAWLQHHFDQALIEEALRRTQDSRSAAARMLDINRATLRKRLNQEQPPGKDSAE